MYKVGDKVRVINVLPDDDINGVEIGHVYVVSQLPRSVEGVMISTTESPHHIMYTRQVELVEKATPEPTQLNFISKTQIAEHLQKVITFYEDYTSDLLKETARDYKKNIIDLKETGYEYRLELDKILVEVEELL